MSDAETFTEELYKLAEANEPIDINSFNIIDWMVLFIVIPIYYASNKFRRRKVRRVSN